MALLQRMYDPQEGTILIDGIPLPEYDIHFLRSRIVIVDQVWLPLMWPVCGSRSVYGGRVVGAWQSVGVW